MKHQLFLLLISASLLFAEPLTSTDYKNLKQRKNKRTYFIRNLS